MSDNDGTKPQDTILVVDDTSTNLTLLFNRFTQAGFKVLVSQDGETALRQAAYAQPDIILLDVMMPGIDGFETCRRLKENEETYTIPVIFMTALADIDSKMAGFEAGGVDYVAKPIDFQEILARIKTHLMIRNLQKSLEAQNLQLEQEINERKQIEAALRQSEERYALAARGANDGLWDWDLRNDYIYFSPRWKNMLGYSEAELQPKISEWFERIHSDDAEQLHQQIELHLAGKTANIQCEYRILHKNQSYYWMLCRGLAVRDSEDNAYRIAGSQTDISGQKSAEEKLRHDALHDTLTGLPNRAMLMHHLENVIQRAKETPNYLFAMFFLDLDNFKLINDTFGHPVGDELLATVSHRLQECVRPSDMVARLGGDEFVILLDNIHDISHVAGVSSRIQKRLADPIELNNHQLFVTVSIGIATNQKPYQQAEDVLRDADTAMYQAKAAGRGQHIVFDSAQHVNLVNRIRFEGQLRQAVENEEFVVFYQPIINLETQEIIRVEALIRWQHPERGLLTPDTFLGIAEEIELIADIDQWVLKYSCLQSALWHAQGYTQLQVAVNMSVGLLQQPQLRHTIIDILDQNKLPATVLNLEVSENTLLKDVDANLKSLNNLGEAGIHISIDDFGAGYSSLVHLKKLPLSGLKIDQLFVQNIGENEKDEAIIISIIDLAHRLKLTVIAEGVENKGQLAFLRKHKCNYVQGYLIGKPMSTEEMTVYLAQKPYRYMAGK
ncbi:EAL domain-containing protein [Anaerolineales bacterium HSG6]|nr:EAL domain-containing protein [Anaerolineales bacterium HSG6]MDM8531187.1 EAL domain-containing protein [Anaerolineales bacterium HSG25]